MCPELADELGSAVGKLLTPEAGMEEARVRGLGILPLLSQRVAKTSQHVAALASLSIGPEQPLCDAGKVQPTVGEIPTRRQCKAKNIPSEANYKE